MVLTYNAVLVCVLFKVNDMSTYTRPSMLSTRRRVQAIGALQLVFDQLKEICVSALFPIQQLAFIIGTSVVTPKETFVLRFPSNYLEGKCVPIIMSDSLFILFQRYYDLVRLINYYSLKILEK